MKKTSVIFVHSHA